MENIILTNNKDLRLVGVKVGVLSTLRFELPLVSESATHVEVIVTSGNVHSAYTATFIDDTKRWQCDIAASQFPAVGKQSYEIAYVLDGKQFWDGKGWIEVEDATTSGIEPQPRPEPYRYVVVSVNGYGADAEGAVRIPKTIIDTSSPVTTEGYMEGDIYFNRGTGATWTLCNVQGALTWVFNYKNYYTKAETEEAIDRVAAYYITYDAAGNPFPTYAALANATTVYSGGAVRVPTRNDYCVVLADETHGGAEYRYIYAVAEGQTTGSWQPQFPVEGVMTVDQEVVRGSQNPVSGGGVWSAIWGALTALPTGFSSLYDWVVSQLGLKRDYADLSYTFTLEDYPQNTFVVSNANMSAVDGEYTYTTPEQAQVPNVGWYKDGSTNLLYFFLVGGRIFAFGPSTAELDASLAEQDVSLPIGDPSAPSGYLTFHLLRRVPNDALALESQIPDVSGFFKSSSAERAFSTSSTYAVGEYCTRDGILYRCTTAVTTAGAWDAAKWTECPLSDLMLGDRVAIGKLADATQWKPSKAVAPVAVGRSASATGNSSVAIGGVHKRQSTNIATEATQPDAIALGAGAKAKAAGAAQIGYSDTANETANSLRFKDTTIVDTNGKIVSSNLDVPMAPAADLAAEVSRAQAAEKLTERFSAWTIVVSPPQGMEFEAVGQPYYGEDNKWHIEIRYRATGEEEWIYDHYDPTGGDDGEDSLHVVLGTFFDCTRTALRGYQLGSQTDKPLASEAEVAQCVKTPTYDGQNHDWLSASTAGSAVAGFEEKGIHRWTMTRKGIMYVRLISGSNSSTVRLGVNVSAGASDVDDAHCIAAFSSFKNNDNLVLPLFLNAGDEVCLSVATNALNYVLFSVFYTD